MTLGEKLQKLRTEAAISQEELAEQLGVSRQAISKWELDKTVPDVAYIVKLSDLFRVSTDYLLKDTPTPEPAATVTASPAEPPGRDRSSLIGTLLLCGDVFFFALILLHFPMLFFFHYRLTLIPLFLVLVLAPVTLVLSRVFLRSPAAHLRLYRHSGAACITLWGLAISTMLGYNEVVDDLLFSMVEGPLSIPLFLGITTVLIGGLYLVALFLMGWTTRTVKG